MAISLAFLAAAFVILFVHTIPHEYGKASPHSLTFFVAPGLRRTRHGRIYRCLGAEGDAASGASIRGADD
ncbi:MAG: hypothetical protein RIC11_05325 [Botrimarina sp.]